MKRQGHLFEQVADYHNLYEAFRRAFRGSGKTIDACRFNFHLEHELLLLKKEIEDSSYTPAPYRYFKISDPKERTISVAHFRDRVVHHAVVGALEPLFEPSFIYDSYATRKDKGTYKAVLRAQMYLKRYSYYLKMDVESYLSEQLELRLKEKATFMNTGQHGLSFLGYRVFPGLIRIRGENLRRVMRRMASRVDDYGQGKISEEKFAESLQSWFAFAGFADSLTLRKMLSQKIEKLFSGQALQEAPTG